MVAALEEPLSLRDLLRDDAATIEPVAALLDGLSHDERLAETRTLGRAEQRRLYRAAERAAPLTLADFVRPGTPARTEVRHHGKNTLPLPGGWKRFQKRMSRPEAGGDRLFGYNESPFVSTIGPGFFVVVPTAGNPDWEARGAVVVDYFQIPDGPVPEGWPAVVPNDKGLQTFVYNKTRDFMRKVSAHVSIGAAYKVESALDHYFVLVRED
jgi:hypothetical protein